MVKIITQAELKDPTIKFERSCATCPKAVVCTVLRAVGPLMAKWDDENLRPFEVTELAKICRHYSILEANL